MPLLLGIELIVLTLSAFQWIGLPPKCHFRWGILTTSCLQHGSLDPRESASKRHLDRFSRFCIVHLQLCDTHTHTDTQTTLCATIYLAEDRIYAIMRPKTTVPLMQQSVALTGRNRTGPP